MLFPLNSQIRHLKLSADNEAYRFADKSIVSMSYDMQTSMNGLRQHFDNDDQHTIWSSTGF